MIANCFSFFYKTGLSLQHRKQVVVEHVQTTMSRFAGILKIECSSYAGYSVEATESGNGVREWRRMEEQERGVSCSLN